MNYKITINYQSTEETNTTCSDTIHYGNYSDTDIELLINILNQLLQERKLYEHFRKENRTI